MKLYYFKRDLNFKLSVLISVIYIVITIIIMKTSNYIVRDLFKITLITLIILVVLAFFIPEDFEYSIAVGQNYITFKFPYGDYIKINRSFTIEYVNKEIVIEDGNLRITIPYNWEVIEFLEQIK